MGNLTAGVTVKPLWSSGWLSNCKQRGVRPGVVSRVTGSKAALIPAPEAWTTTAEAGEMSRY
ncbi:hypothetical protein KIF59_19840 [Enterobacter cloacae subsp. cloacae]|nr:hypothetical protein [Enterobacter cloacae subsp. cloacae]